MISVKRSGILRPSANESIIQLTCVSKCEALGMKSIHVTSP